MSDLHKALLEKCEFDEEIYPIHQTALQLSRGRLMGAEDENTRLLPIIRLLLSDREELVRALKKFEKIKTPAEALGFNKDKYPAREALTASDARIKEIYK